MLIMTVAACLSGAVCGDHISPISDTTILASAGAQCNHIDHVSTQMPYALMIAAMSFVGFLVGGVTGNDILALGVGVVLLVLTDCGYYCTPEEKGVTTSIKVGKNYALPSGRA